MPSPSRPPPPRAAPPRNRILASLPPAELDRLAPHLERVATGLREVLFDVDRPITHVHFPEAMVASVLSVMSDGTAVETATIGNEGIVGLPVFLGTDRTSAQAVAQIPGPSLRMEAGAFRDAVAASPMLALALHRYTQALFTLVAQSAACNRRHAMTERCARWLLHTHDRVGADEFPLTHRFLSQMLGVRRATVTGAMGALQETGAVSHEMGRVRVHARDRLEGAACECYRIIVREFDRLLGPAERRAEQPASPLAGVAAPATADGEPGDGERDEGVR